MSPIKLVAIDLDDTLLRDDLTISRRSQEAIRKVRERGVAVTIATGRMLPSARPYAELLGFDLPLITYQGALVRRAFSDETIYERHLSPEVARLVIRFARERGLQLNYYMGEQLFVERVTPLGEHYAKIAGVPFTRVPDLEEVVQLGAPPKLLMVIDGNEIDRSREELEHQLSGEGLEAHLVKSKPIYLEISHPEATKGTALDRLAQWFGVERDQVMACGDSYNDLEMIRFAGWGVAVANAHPEVRQAARYITASNNEDGVAQALEELVLRR